jgi:glycosyltransferase involved in cell wall biosynthesis
VVDDHSSDDTVDVVQNNFRDERRVKLVALSDNYGAQHARNVGICSAENEWIAFMDSDDEWLPEKMELQLGALRLAGESLFTVVHGPCIIFDEEKGSREASNFPIVEGVRPLRQLLDHPGPTFPSMLVSRKAIYDIGLLNERVGSYQEWDACIQLSRLCDFIYVRQPLFVYYLHGGETISKNKKAEIVGYHSTVKRYKEEIIKECGPHCFDKHIITAAIKAINYGFNKAALVVLESAITSDPRLAELKSIAAERMGFSDWSAER